VSKVISRAATHLQQSTPKLRILPGRQGIARRKKWRFITGQGQRLPGVKTDEHGISTHYPDGTVLLIRWDEVQCVAVETNDSGTWGADVWWLIEGN
jgi:hypothetical protein